MSAFGDALARGVVEIEIDDHKADKQLKDVESSFQRAGDRAGKAFKAGFERNKFDSQFGGINAGGILQISQAVDDLQYGLRGVLNNIPGIVQGLGMGMGVAGAIQLGAIATGQLIDKWEWLGKQVEHTKNALLGFFGEAPTDLSGGAFAEGIKEMTDELEKMQQKIEEIKQKQADFPRAADFIGGKAGLRTLTQLASVLAGQIEDKKAVDAMMARPNRDVAEARKAFTEGVDTIPGGMDTLRRAIRNPNGSKMNDRSANELLRHAMDGMLGGAQNLLKMLPNDERFGEFRSKITNPKLDEEIAEAMKKGEERQQKKRADLALRDDLNRQGSADEKLMWDQKREAEAGDVEKRIKYLNILKDKQEEIAARRNQSQTFSGAKSYLSSVQTSALNQIPRQQLDAIKATNRQLEIANRELAAINKNHANNTARFNGPK